MTVVKYFLLAILFPFHLFGQRPKEVPIDVISQGAVTMQEAKLAHKAIGFDSTKCNGTIMPYFDRMTGDSMYVINTPIKAYNNKNTSESLAIGMSYTKKFYSKDISINLLTITFDVTQNGARCIDGNSEIYLLYDDDTRDKVKNDNKYNCEGRATLLFLRTSQPNCTSNLWTKKVKAIRVMTLNSFIEVDLTKEQGEIFRKTFSCLYNFI